MKKYGKAIAGLIALVVIVFGMGAFFLNHVSLKQEKDAKQENVILEDVAADTSAEINELITKSNKAKFTILEIVPDMSVAELGYLVAGEEPQDWIALCLQGKAEALIEDLGLEYDKEKKWVIDQKQYKKYEEQYGSQDWWEDDLWVKVDPDDEESEYKCKYAYFENYGADDKYNDLIDAIDNGSNKVAILTVTSAQLNGGGTATTTLLENTDMVYIHQNSEYSFSANDNALDLNWSVVRKIFKEVAIREDANGNFDPMTIFFDKTVYTDAIAAGKSVSPVQYTLDRENKKLVSTSYATKTSNGSNNNVCKLYIMSMFRDATEFYNLFLSDVAANGNQSYTESGSFSIQSGDAKNYWSRYTFLPTKEDLQSDGTYKYSEANASYWGTLRISFDEGTTANGSAYVFDLSEKKLLKQWPTALNNLAKALAYEPKIKVTKKEYKVLDIEPAAYSDDTKKAQIKNTITEKIIKLCPYQEYESVDNLTVNVETMTTAEFIGRQDDIVSTYDFVYIGACTDSLWMSESNDSSMKNVIYAHVGAKVELMGSNTGNPYNKMGYALSATETKFYYSGNDITSLKKTELESFVETGYPILISSDLLNSTGTAADSSKFNDTSNNNMYKFINKVMSENQVLPETFDYRTMDSETANKVLQGLDMKKPELTITSGLNGAADGATFTNNGNLSISFKVKDPYDTDSKRTYYKAVLYIDKNADGLYKKDEIFATASSVRGNGGTVTLKKSLNATYNGALTWKLEVTKLGTNDVIKSSKTGYNTVRNVVVGKKMVKVLQIVSDGYIGATDVNSATNKKFYGSTNWASCYDGQQNTDEHGRYGLTLDLTGSFQDYANSQLSDYQLSIKKVRLEEFCDDTHYQYVDPTWLESNYDILIFGFADSYIDYTLTEKAAYSIQKYIDDGHSVMFTHDLTFATNTENFYIYDAQDGRKSSEVGLERHTGFYFTQYFRNTMGMNRFGINPLTPSRGNSSLGVIANVKSAIATGKADGLYDNADSSFTKDGFTYSALMQYGNMPINGTTSNAKKPYIGPYKGLYMNTYANNNNFKAVAGTGYEVNKVSQVNEGQITKYPIDLEAKYSESERTIATTHGQYYQLNMEDPDIVVWYTLDGGWYSASPNDVSNNYYIYNKGNVTYSGVGHRANITDFEKDLFINTIIASLRAGVEGPQVFVSNATYNDGDECYYMQADIDEDSSNYSGYEEIEFNVTNDDDKAGEYMYVSLSDLVKKTGTSTPTPTTTPDTSNTVTIYYNKSTSTTPVLKYYTGSGTWTSGAGFEKTMTAANDRAGYNWKCEVDLGTASQMQFVIRIGTSYENYNNVSGSNFVVTSKGVYGVENYKITALASGSGGGGSSAYDASSAYEEAGNATYTIVDSAGNTIPFNETVDGVECAKIKRSTATVTYTYTLKYPRSNFGDEHNKITSCAVRIIARSKTSDGISKAYADVVISRRSLFNLD